MSYVNQTLTALPLHQIISAPMTAAIEAQAMAAQVTIEFIKEVGFKEAAAGTTPELEYVSFSYTKTDDIAGTETVVIEVPLLTIVPIPYLRIDTFDIDFSANIRESKVVKSKDASAFAVGVTSQAKFRFGWVRADIQASVAYNRSKETTSDTQTATEYNMDIKLHAVQDSLPGGLKKMLSILEGAITD
jgi:hypothetical protein